MAGMTATAQAGVVTADGANTRYPVVRGALNRPATWAHIWFGISVLFIFSIYFGFGGLRGSVAS